MGSCGRREHGGETCMQDRGGHPYKGAGPVVNPRAACAPNTALADRSKPRQIRKRHRGHRSAGKPRRLIASSPKIPHSSLPDLSRYLMATFRPLIGPVPRLRPFPRSACSVLSRGNVGGRWQHRPQFHSQTQIVHNRSRQWKSVSGLLLPHSTAEADRRMCAG
jgi:hypothetical protein